MVPHQQADHGADAHHDAGGENGIEGRKFRQGHHREPKGPPPWRNKCFQKLTPAFQKLTRVVVARLVVGILDVLLILREEAARLRFEIGVPHAAPLAVGEMPLGDVGLPGRKIAAPRIDQLVVGKVFFQARDKKRKPIRHK